MAKVKECKDCHAEIPKKAKKCMHCGTSQQKQVGCLGMTVFIFVAALGISLYGAQNYTPTPPPAPLTAAQKEAKKAQAKLNKEMSDAREQCMNRIMYSAKFPSSVDFDTWDSPRPQAMQGGGWIIRWAFEAKNSLGNLLPQSSRCEVKDGKIIYFKIANR